MVAIIDYDAGNIKSVEKAVEMLGDKTVITRQHDAILNADRVILPGVGAFGDAMAKIRAYGLDESIRETVAAGTPFLGICLGMQVLFENSQEAEGVKGLGLLQGEILRLPGSDDLKIPHIGWNSLQLPRRSALYEGIREDSYVYFVHSYYLRASDEDIVTACTEYGVTVHASVEKDNLFACQFHPEKSSAVGLQILRNFLSVNRRA